MDYIRIQSIDNPLFAKMHDLMKTVFPPEEVLAYEKWQGPLEDENIHVYVAVHEGEVVGTTEYRYYPELKVAMTDFTIVGRPGLGIGRFLLRNRSRDLQQLAAKSGTVSIGMFAEIYDPVQATYEFGGIYPMNPYVRREVLSHIGYMRLDFPYVHPSWEEDGSAVGGLNLCFLPADEDQSELDASLVVTFLTQYYSALPNKPDEWYGMIEQLKGKQSLTLLPL
ncbi:GNAT family N-acetyltransferase [Paenibacillus rhizovicinus]|uniref:GNAT family N-acetyltransferase n=1 Tax=Paenibacillus rhizovicinus TaxID=2704463 RepID=A0A6C0P7Z4_9BACL|nr:GNAT family N-acetyltransferase [Paenibacillus rhizovicinus]QHW34526.1 GNAT family N-acetyltransferase [Paenibacillus rhizovicinus]